MKNARNSRLLGRRSIDCGEFAPNSPARQDGVNFSGHKKPGTFVVISLRKQVVVLGKDVPNVGDEGQPGRCLCGGLAEALARHGVIYGSFEFMLWYPRRQAA
jgi:hypothetical protein